ncbi:unnamed protein product [Brassica oleracea]
MISPCSRHEICGVFGYACLLNSSLGNVMFRLTKETLSRSTIVLRCQVIDRAVLRLRMLRG